ncbi:MAG: BatD family protein [Candidatus Omnitrophica bacterium]|nr:BatD family protein [Candidatus Omnitrophota bacterium]
MKISLRLIILGCLITAAIAAAITHPALAAEKKFEVSLDKAKIAIGEKAQMGLSFYGTQSMPAPDLGNIDGLDIRYAGPSTMMTVINGQVSSSITHMYYVQPLKVGKFQLGPLTFKYKGDNYTSNMVFLEAVEERVMARAPVAAPESAEQLGLGDRLFLTLNVDKQAAYVNELIPVTVKLYVNRLNVSDIQLPTFAQEGFSKVEFKEPKQYRERLGGLLYDVLEFKTSIFGIRPGDYRLGPAKIRCNVMMPKRMPVARGIRDDFFGADSFQDSFYDDFFTRYERYPMEIQSKDVQLGILPLPADGKPSDFTGAVGDYQFIFSASPTKLKTGDPITVRMDINGTGNFNTVLIPKLGDTTGFKMYEPQVKTEENRKSFTQVLIPETDKVTQIPKTTFSYFDPNARQYKTITQGPISIQVEKAKEEAPSQVISAPAGVQLPAKAESELGRDIIYIKESPGPWLKKGHALYRSGIFYTLIIVPFIFIVSLYLFERRRMRFERDMTYAGRILATKAAGKGLKALKRRIGEKDPRVFYEELFKTLQNYLGYRLGIPPAGMTVATAEVNLASRDVDMEIVRKVKSLFETCDKARFAYMNVDDFKKKDDFKDLEEIIKKLERKRL